MPRKTTSRAAKPTRTAVKPARTDRARKSTSSATRGPGTAKRRDEVSVKKGAADAATQRFVNDLLVRGDAQPPDKKGRVPSSATHAIKTADDGSVEVVRVRFKAF
jgi:hypothetical protein